MRRTARPRTRAASATSASVWSIGVSLALLTYAFLHDNSASNSDTAGYGWTRLMEMPRQVRFFEFAAIVGIVVILLITRRVSRTTGWIIAGCFLFTVVATFSYLRRPLVAPVDFARLVYMYLLPLLVFTIARELPWTFSALSRVVKFTLFWVLISAALSWIQYLYFGYEPGDDITGLNQDAHCNVALLLVAMLLMLAQGLFFRRSLRIVLAAALCVTAVLPSALKMLFLVPFIVAVLLWYYATKQRRTRWLTIVKRGTAAIVVIVPLIAVTKATFERIDFRSAPRIPDVATRFAADPWSFGPIGAHLRAVHDVFRSPSSFFLGYGPFSFANPISMGQTREGGALDRFTEADLIAGSGESGEDARVTLTTSLAEEFGVPAFLLLCVLYGVVVWSAHRCTHSNEISVRTYGAAVVPGLLLLLGVGAMSLFASLSSLAFSWPLMIIAGSAAHLHAQYGAAAPAASADRPASGVS